MHLSTYSPNRLPSAGMSYQSIFSAALALPLVLIAPVAVAQEGDIRWEAGVSGQYFNYQETARDGATLNTEKGWLPGFYLSASRLLPGDFQLAVIVSRAKGTVDYEGATQAGYALSTDTTETFTLVGAELATPLPNVLPKSFSGIVGLGYTRWNRKIQPTRYSSHLYEHYRWYEFSGGLRHCSTPEVFPGVEQICVTTKLTRTEYGTMTVRLDDLGLGSPELNLGGDWGGEASLKLDLAGSITLKLYTKTWNHKASKPVIVRQANQYVSITEPASQSWLTGFEAGVRF